MSLLVAGDPPVRSFEFRVACNWTLTRKLILYRVLHTKRGQNGCARRKNRGSPACGHRQQQIEKELSSQGRHRPRPFRKLFTHHRTIYLFNRRSITITTMSPSHLGGRKRSPSWRVQVWNIPFPTRLAQERVRRGLSCSPIKAANLSSKVLSLMIRAGPMEHPGLMITSESDLALILSEKIRLLSSGGSRYFSFKSKLKRVVRAGWWNEPLIKNKALGSNQGHAVTSLLFVFYPQLPARADWPKYGASSQDEPYLKMPHPSSTFLGEATRWDMLSPIAVAALLRIRQERRSLPHKNPNINFCHEITCGKNQHRAWDITVNVRSVTISFGQQYKKILPWGLQNRRFSWEYEQKHELHE